MTAKTIPELWIRRPKHNPKVRFRLFCFPYGGGGVSAYRTWPDGLPPEVEVCPIQLPGREDRLREPLYTHISPLVHNLAEVLEGFSEVPYAFFGHSVGALVAFELAKLLRRENRNGPACLFVSARRAPQISEPGPTIHNLPEDEFKNELRRFDGTPEAVLKHPELMEIFLPILRADFALLETYEYTSENRLDCPITAFGGLQDAKTTQEELAAWSKQTKGKFRLQQFPGGHFFLHDAQPQLFQTIAQDLKRFI